MQIQDQKQKFEDKEQEIEYVIKQNKIVQEDKNIAEHRHKNMKSELKELKK